MELLSPRTKEKKGYKLFDQDAHTAEEVIEQAKVITKATSASNEALALTVREIRDGNLRKLDAENAIGLLATLIAGFSMSMIPEFDPIDDAAEMCHCALWSQATVSYIVFVCKYLHLLGLGVVSVLAAHTVVYTTTTYFRGVKLVSSRKATIEAQVASFNVWFDSNAGMRKLTRAAFAWSLPLFLVTISVTPKVVCTDCKLGLGLFAMMSVTGCFLFGVASRGLHD